MNAFYQEYWYRPWWRPLVLKLTIQRISTTALVSLFACWTASAQSSLALSSSTVTSGGTTSLNLSLAPQAGTSVAALQWTFTYSSAVSNISVVAGLASTAAGKTISCTSGSGSYTCIVSGLNSNPIGAGVVATLSA